MKYQFVAEHQHEYPITRMCQVLEVSVSGYYAWRTRPVSHHQREDARLSAEIQSIFLENRRAYGSPRIHAALQIRGVRCGRKRVVRLMQMLGLQAKQRRQHKPTTTSSDPTAHVAPNLLNRDFTATRPNTKWVTDITAIPTAEGWLYLAVVLDLFSRMVVGWAMDSTENEHLVTLAFQMALARRHPQAGLLHHSDRGSEYTSRGYQALLAELGIAVSMSRTANCYDNAAMESFFDSLKSECVHRTHFQNQAQARSAIFEYLECWYNPVRLHSTLEYVSPLVYEQAFAQLVR
jgi:putative transposase